MKEDIIGKLNQLNEVFEEVGRFIKAIDKITAKPAEKKASKPRKKYESSSRRVGLSQRVARQEIITAFNNELERIRKDLNCKREEYCDMVADAAGLSPHSVSMMLKNVTGFVPKRDKLEQLSSQLGVDLTNYRDQYDQVRQTK